MKKSIAAGAKRGSVGVLILKTLTSGDKYGYEIIKEIEEKSNGEYILKQPSLYSSLKRMETAGLITSYWEDSDIGGRRHYYNISEAGLQKLANSNFQWPENKEFVDQLFNDKENNESNTSPSQQEVDKSEVKIEGKKSISKLQQEIEIEENKKEEFIDKSVNNKKEVADNDIKPELDKIVEKPTKTESGFVLPTINPMQQNLFSSINKQDSNPQEIIEEKEPQIVAEASEEELESTEKIEKEFKINKNKLEEVEQTDFDVKNNQEQNQASDNEKKYTSTLSTYQTPQYDENDNSSFEEIDTKDNNQKPTGEFEEIKYINSIASEDDFKNIKDKLKNKHNNFLNKKDNFKASFNYKTDTDFENSNTLHGSYELKEDSIETINSQNLESNDETGNKAFFDIIEEAKPEIQDKLANENEHKQEDEIETDTDDINYKEILGELFSETGEETEIIQAEAPIIKELPRIDVMSNVNVTLKPKKSNIELTNNIDNTEDEKKEYASNYSYTYTSPTQSSSSEYEINKQDEYAVAFDEKDKIESKQQNNQFNDDYSDSLLEETYLDGVKLRVHKKQEKTPLLMTTYVSINKLHASLSLILFVIMTLQIASAYMILLNKNLISTGDNIYYIGAFIMVLTALLISALAYMLNPLKKQEIHFSLPNKLINNFIILLITLVFIYAVNLFLGMTTLNTLDFISTWLLPAILSINLIIAPIAKFILLKRKAYYM